MVEIYIYIIYIYIHITGPFNAHIRFVQIVLQLAAAATGSRSVGSTPASRQVDVVNFLLEAGMDIEATEEAGATALYLAAENGQLPASWKCWKGFWIIFQWVNSGTRGNRLGNITYIIIYIYIYYIYIYIHVCMYVGHSQNR